MKTITLGDEPVTITENGKSVTHEPGSTITVDTAVADVLLDRKLGAKATKDEAAAVADDAPAKRGRK